MRTVIHRTVSYERDVPGLVHANMPWEPTLNFSLKNIRVL